MFHRPECRKYRQWKREQSKKSKQAVKKEKKIKRRDSIADCIEENEENNVPEAKLKVTFRKCKKKRIRKPRTRATYVLKRIPLAEIVLKTIQPPIEVRERLINLRHTARLKDGVSITDIALEAASTTRTPRRQVPKSRKRRKPVAKKPLKDDEKTKGDEETEEEKTEDQKIDEEVTKVEEEDQKTDEEVTKGEAEDQKTDEEVTKGEAEDQKTDEEVTKGEAEDQKTDEEVTKDEAEDQKTDDEVTESESEDQSTEGKTTKSKTKKSVNDKGTRKRLRRKKIRKKKIVKKDSEEDTMCDSICSFDSRICLAGLKLTSDDKKKIKEYQRQINNESTEENNYRDD